MALNLSLAWIQFQKFADLPSVDCIHSIKAALLANARALIGIHNILGGSFSVLMRSSAASGYTIIHVYACTLLVYALVQTFLPIEPLYMYFC